jgi:hypothetical protein
VSTRADHFGTYEHCGPDGSCFRPKGHEGGCVPMPKLPEGLFVATGIQGPISIPASGMPHTPAQGAAPTAGHRYEECGVVGCSACAERGRVERTAMPVPAAQPGAGDAETSGTGSGRGTGEPGLQISTQTIDGEPLTGPEIISRTLVLAFGTRHHDRAFIKEIAEALDNALRPVHYREAASSIRSVADGMTYAWQATDAKGMRRAASLLDSTARDLDEEAGR